MYLRSVPRRLKRYQQARDLHFITLQLLSSSAAFGHSASVPRVRTNPGAGAPLVRLLCRRLCGHARTRSPAGQRAPSAALRAGSAEYADGCSSGAEADCCTQSVAHPEAHPVAKVGRQGWGTLRMVGRATRLGRQSGEVKHKERSSLTKVGRVRLRRCHVFLALGVDLQDRWRTFLPPCPQHLRARVGAGARVQAAEPRIGSPPETRVRLRSFLHRA
jgi:hypothetical protein